MEYTTLGNTGLLVSTLYLGTMTFGSGQGVYKPIGPLGQSEADELVKNAFEGGSTFSILQMSIRRDRVKRR